MMMLPFIGGVQTLILRRQASLQEAEQVRPNRRHRRGATAQSWIDAAIVTSFNFVIVLRFTM